MGCGLSAPKARQTVYIEFKLFREWCPSRHMLGRHGYTFVKPVITVKCRGLWGVLNCLAESAITVFDSFSLSPLVFELSLLQWGTLTALH